MIPLYNLQLFSFKFNLKRKPKQKRSLINRVVRMSILLKYTKNITGDINTMDQMKATNGLVFELIPTMNQELSSVDKIIREIL